MKKHLQKLLLLAALLLPWVTQAQVTLPYSTGFESGDDINWTFVNDATNAWCIGAAAHNSGTAGLYISNDNGTSNAYTVSATRFSYAYRDFTVSATGQYAVSFDWKANGEGNYDYLRAWIAPTTASLTAGNDPEGGTSAYNYRESTPSGWIDLGGKMNLQTSWQTTVATPSLAAGTYRLVFMWANDASGGSTPPAAIDNVFITELSCPTPTNLSALPSAYQIDLSWTPGGTETEWKVVMNDSLVTFVTDTTYSATDLESNTLYNFEVYAICGAGDTSFATSCTARTTCVAISELPYINDFENEPYYQSSVTPYADAFPSCWTRINTGNATYDYYPYVTTTTSYVHSGSNGLYWYATTGTAYPDNEIAILPPVDLDVFSISNLTLSFFARTTSASYHPQPVIGVMSNPSDVTTFVPVDTLSATDVTLTWQMFSVSFANYTGSGNYIAIMLPRPASVQYLAIDDIFLTDAWCNPLSAVDVAVTSDEVTLSWEANGATSFEVVFGEDTIANVTDTFYTFQELSPNTDYSYSVAVECTNGVSMYVSGIAHTACVALDSLPYIETFEEASVGSNTSESFVNCMTRLNNGIQYFGWPYVSSTSGHNHTFGGSKGLYWYGSTTATTYGDYMYAVLPAVDTDVFAINTLQLRFWARATSASYNPVFHVGVMTNPLDPATFQTVDTITINGITAFEEFTTMFDNFEGNGQYVAIRALRPSSTWYANIDDITLEQIPTCKRSEELAVDSLSYDYVRLTWQNTSDYVDSYTVYYSTDPMFSLDTCPSVVVYDTVAELYSLPEETDFYWTVIADCGSGDLSIAPERKHFRTLRDCGEGYVNLVGNIGNGTSSSYTYFTYNYSSYPFGHSACLYTSDELVDLGLLTGANINSISVHAGATGCTIPNLKVYAGPVSIDQFSGASDTNLFSNLTLVYDSSLTTVSEQWVTIQFDTSLYFDGTSNMVFYFRRESTPTANGTFYYTTATPKYMGMYGYRTATSSTATATRVYYRVDMQFNMCAEVPSCVRPSEINVVSLLDTSATFNWEAIANSYQYVVVPQGVDPDSANYLSTVDTFAVIPGLSQSTEYDFYVRSICSGGMISDWSLAYSFRTPCSAVPLPYTENFENYGSGSTSTIDPCWTKGTNSSTAYPYPNGTNAVSGSRSLYFYAYHPSSATATPYYSYAALPMMAAPVDTLMVSFSLRRYTTTTAYYTTYILVGVMTDPSDINTFVGVDTIDLQAEASLSVHNFEVSFNNYTGNGQYIAFYAPVPPTYAGNNYSYSYGYLDDIVVDYIPNCRRILDIVVDTTTEHTATISWTDPYQAANGYEIEYGPEGFFPGTGTNLTTYNTTETLTGLDHSTGYDFYVRPRCSATENGPWSFATHFRTVCGIHSVPFVEDFESYGSGSSYGIDPCWFKGTNSATPYPYPYSTSAINGDRSLYFYSYHPSSATATAYYSYVALPEFNVGVDSLELSFKVRRYSTTTDYYTTRLLVGVMTDPNDISTFVGVDTIDLKDEPANSIHDIVVELTSYTGTGKHIAIFNDVPPLYGTSTYTYCYAYVDDISVNMASACGRPIDLEAATTNNTITIDWTDTVGATQWQIEYGPTGFELGQGTVLNVSQKPYTITGLTASTLYDVYVRSWCSSGELGGTNNSIFTVSTSQAPAAIPYYYNFENAAEWNNWQTVSNNQVGWYRGTAEAAEGNYGLYVSVDSGATCNSLHNAITNAAVYRDIDFGSTESSFEVTFLAKSAGVNDANYEGINVMLVDPSLPVNASSTALTTPWGSFNVAHVVRDTNWNSHTVLFDNVSGVKRLVFNWFTSTTTSHPVWQGAGAIDSITVNEQSCVRPTNTAVTNVGSDFVSLQWDGPANANYLVRLREIGTTTNIDNLATTNSYTVNNLTPQTDYYVWVYRVCDTNNISYSAPRIEFSTTCTPIAAIDTFYEDFNSYTGTDYGSAGILPDCWEGYSNGTNAVYMPHVTDGNTYSYSVSGNAITLTSGSAAYGDVKIVRLPKFDEPVNTLTMSYWYCTESSTNGTLYVGYMTGLDFETDFVPVVAHPASTASMHSGNGAQAAGHGIFDTVSFDSVPSNALFIAFKWVYNTSFYSCCIDNVEVISSGIVCNAPVASVDSLSYNSASVSWMGDGNAYEIAVKETTAGTWPAEIAVAGTTYTFTGLTPATEYTFRVRQDCDSIGYSDWVYGTLTTDSLPCLAPTNVTVSDITNHEATITWTPSGNETAWEVNIFASGQLDTTVYATATTVTVDGLTSNTTYSVKVRALCGDDHSVYGEWSVPAQFTTVACPTVTNLHTTAVLPTTIAVAWNAVQMAEGYELEYGVAGFTPGSAQGTVVEISGTSYTIENLQPMQVYDIYVTAVCGDNWYSEEAATLTNVQTPDIEDDQFVVTVTSNNPAWGTVTGSGVYTAGTQVTLTATPTDAALYRFVEWSDGVTDNPRVITVTENITLVGNFAQITGIESIEGVSFNLYPNPAKSSTTVSILGMSGKVRIAVVDVNGREVIGETIECSADCEKRMDIDGLTQGAYFVRVTGEQGTIVRKLMVK